MNTILILQVKNAINVSLNRVNIYTEDYIEYLRNMTEADIQGVVEKYGQAVYGTDHYDELFDRLIEDWMDDQEE